MLLSSCLCRQTFGGGGGEQQINLVFTSCRLWAGCGRKCNHGKPGGRIVGQAGAKLSKQASRQWQWQWQWQWQDQVCQLDFPPLNCSPLHCHCRDKHCPKSNWPFAYTCTLIFPGHFKNQCQDNYYLHSHSLLVSAHIVADLENQMEPMSGLLNVNE